MSIVLIQDNSMVENSECRVCKVLTMAVGSTAKVSKGGVLGSLQIPQDVKC